MKKNTALLAAITVNGLIILLEAIGLALSLGDHGAGMFQYYTQDSNYFALFASILYEVFAFRRLSAGKPVPRAVTTIRYMATACLMLTFFVVLFVLIPMSGIESAVPMLTRGSMLYHHLLCPILAAVSFLFFERDEGPARSEIALAMIPTGVYAIVLIVLNITKTVYGPYPFLHVYEQPVWMSAVWVVVILGMALLFAWALWFFRSKAARRRS